MMLSPEEIELRYHRTVAQQAREQEAKRFLNPDRDYTLEDVWVAYAWTPENKADLSKGEWLLAGFRRKRHRRKPQTMNRFFSKVRRRLGVDKKCPVTLMDLETASRRIHSADQSWRFRPPQFQKRKPKIVITKPPLLTKKGPKIRAKVRAKLFNKKTTVFVALGRNTWERTPGYLYLGPLVSDQKRFAQYEAKRLFPIYDDRLIIAAAELSKPLQAAMARSKKVRAGVTRLAWPEVPPTFDAVWEKLVAAGKITEFASRDTIHAQWLADGSPWLTRAWILKQIKQATPLKSRVVWKERSFQCVKCKGSGKTPSTIQHASALCVPISAKENKVCAANAKQIAKRNADKLRKRKDRRDERKHAKESARRRKLAAKKAARTRARKSVKKIAKTAKRVTRKITIRLVAPRAEPERTLGTLKIVAILRSIVHGRR